MELHIDAMKALLGMTIADLSNPDLSYTCQTRLNSTKKKKPQRMAKNEEVLCTVKSKRREEGMQLTDNRRRLLKETPIANFTQ